MTPPVDGGQPTDPAAGHASFTPGHPPATDGETPSAAPQPASPPEAGVSADDARAAASSTDLQDDPRFRLLVGSVTDYAIFLLDPDGAIATWNPGAERLKQYTQDEIVGQPYAVFYPPEDREAGVPERMLAQAREHGRATHSGWRVRWDGSRFWADVVLTALYEDDGALAGFAKVTRDMTERHEAEQARRQALVERQRAVEALEELDRWRRDFISSMAHDLQTPVVAISGFARLLLEDWPDDASTPDGTDAEETDAEGTGTDGTDPDGTGPAGPGPDGPGPDGTEGRGSGPDSAAGLSGGREFVERILSNAETLEGLIDNLRTYSHLESGRVRLDPEPVALDALVEEVLADMHPVLDAHRARSTAERVTVEADCSGVERVLRNLLGNAARHTPPDGAITVRVEADGSGGAIVEVADEGEGLAPEVADRLFERFARGRGGRTGLGLAIVKEYVELHGGHVEALSPPGAGTTVRFTLPAAPPAASVRARG